MTSRRIMTVPSIAIPPGTSVGRVMVPVMIPRTRGAGTVIDPTPGGRSVDASTTVTGIARTAGVVRTHRRTHVPPIRPAVPQAVHGKPQRFRPVRIARKKVALLLKIMMLGIIRFVGAATGVVGGGGIAGVAIQHSALLLLCRGMNGYVGRTGAMIPVRMLGGRGRGPAPGRTRCGHAAGGASGTGRPIVAGVGLEFGGCGSRDLLVSRSGLVGGKDPLA
mmetsp:Transcript_21739/g.37332  ORF Transcript_21739/g.37332 Transcript_21739/m.37332 type:complete len:220 (-) Transcript_21739:411-1070(-)